MGGRLFKLLQERMATDGQACRTCSLLLLVLSLTILLPPVVIDLLIGGKALNAMAYILTGREFGVALGLFGPVLVAFFLPAIIAAILGMTLLFGTFDRRRCGKLLLWYVGFSVLMLVWPLLPIPWKAMGVSNAFVSRLDSFSWTAMMGLTAMEGWAVIPHVLAIVVLWSLTLTLGVVCCWRDVNSH